MTLRKQCSRFSESGMGVSLSRREKPLPQTQAGRNVLATEASPVQIPTSDNREESETPHQSKAQSPTARGRNPNNSFWMMPNPHTNEATHLAHPPITSSW